MFVIKCKTNDAEKFLTKGSHLGTLEQADKYESRGSAECLIDMEEMRGFAKVRRFIPKGKV